MENHRRRRIVRLVAQRDVEARRAERVEDGGRSAQLPSLRRAEHADGDLAYRRACRYLRKQGLAATRCPGQQHEGEEQKAESVDPGT